MVCLEHNCAEKPREGWVETEAETEGGQTEEKLKGKERWMEELK